MKIKNRKKRSWSRFDRPENKIKANERITASSVLVINSEGENLGEMETKEAIRIAKEAGLDLVEVSKNTSPPVTKIISFDKYRYQQEKIEKEKKKKQKSAEKRGVRITPRVASNDLKVKLKKVMEFLEAGDIVEIQLFLKGREKANKDFARGKLEEFLAGIPFEYKVINPIKYAGRGFQVSISKK